MRKHKTQLLTTVIVILIGIILFLSYYIFTHATPKVEVESHTTEFSLKHMGKLVTQAGYYTNVQKIDNARDLVGYNVPWTESILIYSLDGVVKAGIDFTLVDFDINEETKQITVSIPPVEILGIEIFEDSRKVYYQQESIFNDIDFDIISESRIKMEEEVTAKAEENGIYDAALTNAENLITAMLSTFYPLSEYQITYIQK